MASLNPLGRDWGDLVNWDSLGKFYASVAIVWTVVLYAGATWLYVHRHVPYLKLRNIPLAITAISFLHIYLVKILLAYTTNGHFPCAVEFWIMSIYLPFGIALSQANLSQLLSVSIRQKRLLDGGIIAKQKPPAVKWTARGLWSTWRGLSPLQRGYVYIGIGMFFQVVVAATIYGTSGKLQGDWGNLTYAKGQAACRKGLEWIPTAMWQLFFCCIYGPYLLYRVRNIKDTHFWRLQVLLCVISGFPGAPLWLAAVFDVAFKPANKWWVPPMWLAPGIFVMQAVTIFFPIYEHYINSRLSSRTLSILESMSSSREDVKKWDTSGTPNSRPSTSNPAPSCSKTSFYPDAQMYTLAALEKTLNENPGPLLQFAATQDFTAESIIFLIGVHTFRGQCQAPGISREQLWNQARDIYIKSVCEGTAEFPINIEYNIRSPLDRLFGPSIGVDTSESANGNASIGMNAGWEWEETSQSQRNKISPFANIAAADVPLSPLKGGNWTSTTTAETASQYPLTPTSTNMPTTPTTFKSSTLGGGNRDGEGEDRDGDKDGDSMGGCHEIRRTTSMEELTWGGAGEDVDLETVFDVAERSIKYLVVTNTWRKYVTERMGGGSAKGSLDGTVSV